MRKLPAVLLAALLFGGAALPAAAADVDGPASIVARALDVVQRWAAKLGALFESDFARTGLDGNKAGSVFIPGGLTTDDDDDRPIDSIGPIFDPNG